MYLNIQESAIFVADSHFNKKNQEFLVFLEKLQNEQIITCQVFLIGDMIDFISGESKYFIKKNKKIIDILNYLSSKIEIIYLEGNHDYNLAILFPKIKVIKIENQPLYAKYQNKSVALSHGDNFINWHYDLYCKIIRNTIFLRFMNLIDFNYKISKKIENNLLKKKICHKINNFEQLVKRRVSFYESEIIIEGHYHQGGIYKVDNKTYINIPSLCCDKQFIRLIDNKFIREEI